MCFYLDDGEPCRVWRPTIINRSRNAHKCCSCDRGIVAGEQHLYVFCVMDDGPEKFRMCNLCCQDYISIHRAELIRGCKDDVSWPYLSDTHELITVGNEDNEPELETDSWRNGWITPVLFWPYMVPPATKPANLKEIPDFVEHLKLIAS